MRRVIVIGAGIGGLTTAAVLARAGLDVTVLESHVYPGGCAGTYYHQGYRFDAGATLAAGFYPGGPMDMVAQAVGVKDWATHPAESAMVVHLPGGKQFSRRTRETPWEEIHRDFGQPGLDFFRWQEITADALWDLALRLPPWPPQSISDLAAAASAGLPWMLAEKTAVPGLAADAFRPVAAHLHGASSDLRMFVDAQLLISAQTTSDKANALYSAAALDLPRRGVVHLSGGMGAIAHTLADAVCMNGGRVLYRHQVTRIRNPQNLTSVVETKRQGKFQADLIIANLTPWNVIDLIQPDVPNSLRHFLNRPGSGWGAFMLYIGMDSSILPPGFPLHHQVIAGSPLGEGNSVFASLSPEWDSSRAPKGMRALTVSTHTRLEHWWNLYKNNRAAYEQYKDELSEKVMVAVETAIPGVRSAANLILPGTPVTFQRFTNRKWGWVGGFPQTGLLSTLAPRLAPNLWLVGDSIFPGQSTAAAALGGLRVAKTILSDRRK